jgi:hypothetical protein
MESRSILPTGLKSGPVRDHLFASALGMALFILLFSKALFGGYNYGALPQQQYMGVTWQNPWIAQTDLPVTERQPSVVDPDYHFLLDLDSIAAARELRAGHLPFFDFGRMLGVPLWGSLTYDFGNPLNLLLRYFSAPQVHLMKVLVSMLLAANGFVLLMRELGARTSIPWVVATLLYLGSNYTLYYIHTIGAYEVMCVAPMLLGVILRFLRTGGPGSFLGSFLCAGFVIVAHYTHVAVHLMILCAVACAVALLLGRKEWRTLVVRIGLLGLAGLCAAVACSEILRQVNLTSADSSRLAAKIVYHGYPYMEIPKEREAFSTLFFGNIETSGSYWESLFIPWPAILCIGVLFAGAKPRTRGVRLMGWLAVFFAVYFFVGWIDLPLYPLMGKLYAPNPMAWRGLLSFYLPLWALAGLGCERMLLEPVPAKARTWAWVGLAVAASVAVVIIAGLQFPKSMLFQSSGMLYESYIRSWGFWLVLAGIGFWLGAMLLRGTFRFRSALVVVCAMAICVGIGTSRLPFYRPADVAHVTRGDAADINTPRVSRLLPGTEYLLGAANVEMRFAMDSPLSTLGLKMLTGYHTSMSRQELKVFDTLVSDYHLKARDHGALHTYSFGYYRTFLDGRALVRNNTLRLDKVLLLKLLGVDYVIDGASLSRINPEFAYDFSHWPGVSLQVPTVSHLVEGVPEKEVFAVFNGTLEDAEVTNMLARLSPARFAPTADGRGYRLDLEGKAGTLVVPYHFGRFFNVTLDGQVVAEKEGLGVCIVEVAPQNKVLEIRSRREGIVARTLGGILAGCLMAAAGCFGCSRLTKPAAAAAGASRPVAAKLSR